MRDVVSHRDARNQSLRTIASRHPDHVCPIVGRVLCQLEQIVTRLEQHRLDATLAGLSCQVEALGLAAAGLGVDQ
jgi:hypothetical protein